MLMSEWSAGTIGAYDLDALGNPIVGSRRDFTLDLEGAEGAAIDPSREISSSRRSEAPTR